MVIVLNFVISILGQPL